MNYCLNSNYKYNNSDQTSCRIRLISEYPIVMREIKTIRTSIRQNIAFHKSSLALQIFFDLFEYSFNENIFCWFYRFALIYGQRENTKSDYM